MALLKTVRKGTRLRIDDVTITTPSSMFTGRGIISATKGNFRLEVTLPEGTSAPPPPVGTISIKDFWKLTGTIEDHLTFTIPALPPANGRIWYNSRIGSIKWDVVPAVDLAYQFFLQNSQLSKSAENLP